MGHGIKYRLGRVTGTGTYWIATSHMEYNMVSNVMGF
jgi:hypothetical protein